MIIRVITFFPKNGEKLAGRVELPNIQDSELLSIFELKAEYELAGEILVEEKHEKFLSKYLSFDFENFDYFFGSEFYNQSETD